MWRLGALELDLDAAVLRGPAGPVGLTPQEVELLSRLLESGGGVCARETLLPQASARRVDRVVSELRRKLEPDPKHPRLLLSVYGQGYRLELSDSGPVTHLLGRRAAFAYLARGESLSVWGPPGAGCAAVAQALGRSLGPAQGALTLGGLAPELAGDLLLRAAGREVPEAAELCALVGHLPGPCLELGARARLMTGRALLQALTTEPESVAPRWWAACSERWERLGGGDALRTLACAARPRLSVPEAAALVGRSELERLHRQGWVSWEPPGSLYLPTPFQALARRQAGPEHWRRWMQWLEARVASLRTQVHGPRGGEAAAELVGLRPELERLITERPDERALAVRLVVSLDTACRRLGHEGWLREQHEALLSRVTQLPAHEASELWQVRSEWLRLRGQLSEAAEAAEAGVRRAESPGGEASRSMAFGQRAVVHQSRSQWPAAIADYQRALDASEDRRLQASFLANLAQVQLRVERDTEGEATLERLVRGHRERGEARQEARARGTLARHLLEIGAYGRAQAQLEAVDPLLEGINFDLQHALHPLRWGMLRVAQRTGVLAREDLGRALNAAGRLGEPRTAAMAQGVLGILALQDGLVEEAVGHLQASIQGHASAGRPAFASFAACWSAWCALELGQPVRAEKQLAQARRWGRAPEMVQVLELVQAARLGDAADAQTLAVLRRKARRSWELRMALRLLARG
ncbi:MAG: helix-turn-helix domain-containing protein [Myxococcota bacterium]|nr:helix-turn-helix domain-containing protein [Myxococcota bacterium]